MMPGAFLSLLATSIIGVPPYISIVAVSMMLIAPQGVWGLIKQRVDIEIFPVRRLISAERLAKINRGS